MMLLGVGRTTATNVVNPSSAASLTISLSFQEGLAFEDIACVFSEDQDSAARHEEIVYRKYFLSKCFCPLLHCQCKFCNGALIWFHPHLLHESSYCI